MENRRNLHHLVAFSHWPRRFELIGCQLKKAFFVASMDEIDHVIQLAKFAKAVVRLLHCFMKLKLTARKREVPGVESFIFKPAEPIVWQAGQYLHYVLNHAPTDDRGSDRWFTIASAPYERHVMVTTRFADAKGK